MANDLNLTDMETCYKAVRSDVLKSLRLTSDGFGLEPEITARLAQWGARIYEVPISYDGRTYAEGKSIGWKDGVEALWLIFKFRFLDTRATNDDSLVTRQSLGNAPRFRKWLLGRFSPFIGNAVLEVNAGPGHTTSHLLEQKRLVVTDSDPVHVETLRRRFGHLENVEVWQASPSAADLAFPEMDTVILFDGLQREIEPKELLAGVAKFVESNGHILIQVPAGREMYGPADEVAGHLRRFDRQDLVDVVTAAGLELVSIENFNRLGAIAWRMQHTLGSPHISGAQAKVFDLLVPFARRFDAVSTGPPLSWLVVARVP